MFLWNCDRHLFWSNILWHVSTYSIFYAIIHELIYLQYHIYLVHIIPTKHKFPAPSQGLIILLIGLIKMFRSLFFFAYFNSSATLKCNEHRYTEAFASTLNEWMFVLFVQIVFPVSPNIFHFLIIPWYHAQNVKQPLTPKIHLNIIVSLKEALSSTPSQS